ncbi:hypothetical protein EDB85DRAFT_646559 [Lactarius pseudohatsudake]|nr:hypothetical protein EDB85DRAFT_646559 [Lactarius pseudohatsudake]
MIGEHTSPSSTLCSPQCLETKEMSPGLQTKSSVHVPSFSLLYLRKQGWVRGRGASRREEWGTSRVEARPPKWSRVLVAFVRSICLSLIDLVTYLLYSGAPRDGRLSCVCPSCDKDSPYYRTGKRTQNWIFGIRVKGATDARVIDRFDPVLDR